LNEIPSKKGKRVEEAEEREEKKEPITENSIGTSWPLPK
jgi:hypothetical protein